MADLNPLEVINELGYITKRSSLYAGGKQIAVYIGENVGEFVRSFGAVAAGFGAQVGTVIALGLASAVSAALTQMDFIHKRQNLTNTYKEELAAKLHKPVKEITKSDLENISKDNSTIGEELGKCRRQRNYGVALSIIATMASLGVVMAIFPGAVAGLSMAALGEMLIHAVVGLAVYNVVKTPLHWAADKIFGLDEETTHDRVVAIKRDRDAGKIITPEQVLGVFAKANPQLERFIATEYGQNFDRLSHDEKSKATDELSKLIPLDRLTQDINTGKINATELAFSVEGEISGVEHKVAPEIKKAGFLESVLSKVTRAFSNKKHFTPDKEASELLAIVNSNMMGYEEGVPSGKFVEKLGLSKKDMGISHVERVDQSRAEQVSPTLQ